MEIRCNNQKRPVIYGFELTKRERAEFDYLDDIENAQFFRYKGAVYDLGEFMRIGPNIAPHPQRPGWEKFDGYSSDSFFSGVLVKFADDFESVIVGQYFC